MWKDSLIKIVVTVVEVWRRGDEDAEEGHLVCGHTRKSEKVAPGKGSSGRVGWGGPGRQARRPPVRMSTPNLRR